MQKTWEVANTYNLGVEGSLWKGLLGFEIDLFKTKRSNILRQRNASIPQYTGLKDLPDENIGKVQNKGVEIQLNHRSRIGEVDFSASGNFLYARNKVIYMDETPWIGDGRDINYQPASYFRKKFSAGKTILSARAYIAVAGLYELYINGEKIGNHRLDPMYTRFDRRNLYVTYDVTKQLQKGDNAVGVLLGNGWYNHQSMAVWDFHRAPCQSEALCYQLCP